MCKFEQVNHCLIANLSKSVHISDEKTGFIVLFVNSARNKKIRGLEPN